MRLNEISTIIEKHTSLYGESCTIEAKGKAPVTTKVILNQMWRKNKTKFEKLHTPIGMNEADYYIGVFPASYDIRGMGIEDTVTVGDKVFYFVRAEGVFVGDRVQYYSAVLRRIYEEV